MVSALRSPSAMDASQGVGASLKGTYLLGLFVFDPREATLDVYHFAMRQRFLSRHRVSYSGTSSQFISSQFLPNLDAPKEEVGSFAVTMNASSNGLMLSAAATLGTQTNKMIDSRNWPLSEQPDLSTEVRKLHTLVEPFLLLASNNKIKKGTIVRVEGALGSADLTSNLMGQTQTFVINPAGFGTNAKLVDCVSNYFPSMMRR